jgi:hypothetical protein
LFAVLLRPRGLFYQTAITMEHNTSLDVLPSDVLRIVLNHAQSRPFTLGVLGRVCRDLYAKTNTLEDLWHRLATMTPDAGSANAESSAGESKVAASRSKLNRFAALVKRIKLGQCNVTAICEAKPAYVPESRNMFAEENRGPTDEEEEDQRHFYRYKILNNYGSDRFLVAAYETHRGEQRLEGSFLVRINQSGRPTFNSPASGISWREISRLGLVGGRFALDHLSTYQGDAFFSYYDLDKRERMNISWGPPTHRPMLMSHRAFQNQDSSYPWVFIYFSMERIPNEAGAAAASQQSRGGGLPPGRWNSLQNPLVAVYDLLKVKYITEPIPFTPIRENDESPVFFQGEFLFTFELKGAESSEWISKCFRVDVKTSTLCLLWTKPGIYRIFHLNGSIATATIPITEMLVNRHVLLSMIDGSVLFACDRAMPPLDECGGHGRFIRSGSDIYDIFHPYEPIFRLSGDPEIHFLDPAHWLVNVEHSMHLLDFGSKQEIVDTEITCCALGDAEIGNPTPSGYPVTCEASLIDIPVSNILQSISQLLGCQINQISTRKFWSYPS